MIADWLHRKARTHTQTTTESAAVQQRRQGLRSALGLSAAVQMGAQMLLWVTFYGYDALRQTVWIGAMTQLLPLAVLWCLWRWARPALPTAAGRMACLPLALCAMADGALLLCALSGYLRHLIPEYPFWVSVAAPAALCLLAMWLSGENGTMYGCQVLGFWLIPLFLLSTLALGKAAQPARLQPLLGPGVSALGLGALGGWGCSWGVCAMHPAGQERIRRRELLWPLAPFAALMLWALWYAMVRPWAAGDGLSSGAKLTALARHAQSMTLYELSALLWMLLLPLACVGCLRFGQGLMQKALPGWPRALWPLVLLAPGIVGLSLMGDGFLSLLGRVLPYRSLMSLGCGIAVCIIRKRGKSV